MRTWIVPLAAALVLASSCGDRAVTWSDPVEMPGDTLGTLSIATAGMVVPARPASPAHAPVDPRMCTASLVTVRDSARWFAAWFRVRPDSSVAVVAARSDDDGKTWSTPGMADSLDVAKVGCDRPPPSIAASAGYVHLAYSLEAPEGFGVFFAHSMDQTATFHAALPVIYGDRMTAASVAASGMQVAVAYEDPNGHGDRVDLAFSRTQGHTFEPRVRGSPDELGASRPEVALGDSTVAISFATQAGPRMVRVGTIR